MIGTLSIVLTHILLLIAFLRLAQRRATDADPPSEGGKREGQAPHDP